MMHAPSNHRRPRHPIARLLVGAMLGVGLASGDLAASASDAAPAGSENPSDVVAGESQPASQDSRRATRTPDPPAGPTGFDAPEDPADITQVARVALVADVARVRPGETFHLAITASMARHWHTYWLNPGDTGVAARVSVRAPEGFTVGALRYPRPEVITGPEGTTYGYDEEAWIFIPVTAPSELAADGAPLAFTVDVMYLVCRDLCLIGNDTLSLSLPAAAGDGRAKAPADARTMAAMRPWLARLPAPLAERPGASMSVDLDAGRLDLVLPADEAAGRPVVLPAPGPGVQFGKAAVRREGERWLIRIPLTLSPGNTLGQPYVVRGLVGLGTKPDGPSWHFQQDFPVPADGG